MGNEEVLGLDHEEVIIKHVKEEVLGDEEQHKPNHANEDIAGTEDDATALTLHTLQTLMHACMHACRISSPKRR